MRRERLALPLGCSGLLSTETSSGSYIGKRGAEASLGGQQEGSGSALPREMDSRAALKEEAVPGGREIWRPTQADGLKCRDGER